jgi:glycosyltransferase involved in cell wall biosynthesis
MFYYSSQSFLRQTFKPDLILVNISKEPYLMDSGITNVPEWLNQRNFNLNVVKNIGSYRKLLPAIEVATDSDIIVTADDDVIYSDTWLELLVNAANNDPNSIICSRARLIRRNIFKNWQNYYNWTILSSAARGIMVLPTGCGGVVYRKNLLDIDFLKDNSFLKLAPTMDDLWFKIASVRKRVLVSVFPEINNSNLYFWHKTGLDRDNMHFPANSSFYFEIINRLYLSLMNYMGVNQSPNDKAWDLIVKYSGSTKWV